MNNNNLYKIEGIIYEKPVRTVVSKKKATEGQTFEFPSIILEVKREFNGRTFTDLPEFELGKGVNIDDFAVKDSIEITFAVGGKRIGDWHKTSLKALYIRHTDIQGDDSLEVGTPKADKETVFVAPNPADMTISGTCPSDSVIH